MEGCGVPLNTRPSKCSVDTSLLYQHGHSASWQLQPENSIALVVLVLNQQLYQRSACPKKVIDADLILS